MTTLEEVRARFARDLGLPFAESLTEARILDALNGHGVTFRDRLFNPVDLLHDKGRRSYDSCTRFFGRCP